MSVHVTAEVLMTKRIGAHQHLTLVAPGVGELVRPGSFLAASIGRPGEATAHLARRPLWIHKVQPMAGYGATVQVVVEPVGPGTRWLAGLAVGDRLDVTGPLGRPFALPREPVATLLVGEAHGVAALQLLAERLHERGCPVSLLLGAPDEARLLPDLELRRTARSVVVVTADGSVGQRGDVADLVGETLRRSEAQVVYAAAGLPALHAVARAAEEHGAWSQTAVAMPLPCATGLCQGCPLPVVAEDGVQRTVRGCVEGPVVRGDRVRWDDLRAQAAAVPGPVGSAGRAGTRP
ncbi:hypothetical protein K8Z61_05005 [Nocardioides sp. TRM66260-LWL]|uniref:iron-sulfur cluster-binding protein n=1 Tax=Nocardioides sp. TRM66260-LWL TaxID=2874478 RepID=UPI001CC3C335|nr:hypothetical protein [Nocardioides sp. TRM66260-LWL]MBZ5733846.1 hypothetical protein [Nocardioides sp. TRM66260-LWL]